MCCISPPLNIIVFQVKYEAWKLREMKRLKRDREEAEAVAKEQAELERLRNLTEEERRLPIIWKLDCAET